MAPPATMKDKTTRTNGSFLSRQLISTRDFFWMKYLLWWVHSCSSPGGNWLPIVLCFQPEPPPSANISWQLPLSCSHADQWPATHISDQYLYFKVSNAVQMIYLLFTIFFKGTSPLYLHLQDIRCIWIRVGGLRFSSHIEFHLTLQYICMNIQCMHGYVPYERVSILYRGKHTELWIHKDGEFSPCIIFFISAHGRLGKVLGSEKAEWEGRGYSRIKYWCWTKDKHMLQMYFLQQPLLMLVCEAVTGCDRCCHCKVCMSKI